MHKRGNGGGYNMDVKEGNASRVRATTSMAAQAERRRARIGDLCERIQKILQVHEGPLDLAAIEFFLKVEQWDRGGRIESLDTFDVRDAVSELVRTGVVAYAFGSEVRLVAKPSES